MTTPDRVPLERLLHEAANVRKICRQMCLDDGVEPDEIMTVAYGKEFKNWEYHVANVNAVLRAMKAIAS